MTKVAKRTFHATIQFNDGIMDNSVDYLIEAYDKEKAQEMLDGRVKIERENMPEERYDVNAGSLREYKTHEELVGFIQMIKTHHDMRHFPLKMVDMCRAVDNNDRCIEGCDSIVGVDYGEPKIEVNGSEMSVRHIGRCTHGVVIMDRVMLYKAEDKSIEDAIRGLKRALDNNIADMLGDEKKSLMLYIDQMETDFKAMMDTA